MKNDITYTIECKAMSGYIITFYTVAQFDSYIDRYHNGSLYEFIKFGQTKIKLSFMFQDSIYTVKIGGEIAQCLEFYKKHIQHAPIEWKLEFIKQISNKYSINGDQQIDLYSFIKEWAKIED